MAERIYLYDSTLRDGAQTQGVDFSVVDKQEIAHQLDDLGIDYVEAGWPGANPTDDAFFEDQPKLDSSKIVAFGMTRRAHQSASNDPGLNALVNTGAKTICIVGKSWDFQVTEALGTTLEENLAMIEDSVSYLVSKKIEVIFDAEHFFDGFKKNEEYAMQAAETAYKAGARWVALCDTNGGTLPHEVEEIVTKVTKVIPGENLGIHCHNDTENGVSNAIAAVRAGARQVQGTIDGYGERCGNTNLISLIPTLMLKMGYDTGISKDTLKQLTKVAHSLDDRLHRPRYRHAAYVGSSAFAHKGGLHVSAVLKNPTAYEHVEPESVGNERQILVSDQAGRSNFVNRLKRIGFNVDANDEAITEKLTALMEEVKNRENQGYAYDGADASFEILAHRFLGDLPDYFTLKDFRIIDERRFNAKGELVVFSEAKVKLLIDGQKYLQVAEGNGPFNALTTAIQTVLSPVYPVLEDVKLVDFNVRIITPNKGTGAVTRVQIDWTDDNSVVWTTVGVSENIIDASFNALQDSFIYKLHHSQK